jgi:hypothetical protein
MRLQHHFDKSRTSLIHRAFKGIIERIDCIDTLSWHAHSFRNIRPLNGGIGKVQQ